MTTVDAAYDVVEYELAVREEAKDLANDYYGFVRAAWPTIEPHTPFKDNWHIPAICESLTAVTNGQIRHLQIWVPPGSMKSILASIMWPAWEWTTKPWLRYITGSYDGDLATDFSRKSRDVVLSEWYQLRWPDVQMRPDANKQDDYITTEGGRRFVTSPDGGVTGRHAHRIIIDDPLKPMEIASAAKIEKANKWYSGTLGTRAADPTELAEVIIMQRLHTNDLAAYAQQFYDDWEIVCLPERYDPKHKFLWVGDQRTKPGELLWPKRVGEKENRTRVAKLGSHEAEGQLQQNPTALEGDLLKRKDWRYYDKKVLDRNPGELQFTRVVTSWDTAFKDKTSSDFVVGQAWGIMGADRFFVRTIREQMAFGATKRAIKEFDQWIREVWPYAAVYHVIEKSANGTDIIEELQREIPGVIAKPASVDKWQRAQAAQPTLESNNCWLPGKARPDGLDYDPGPTPPWVQSFVEETSQFDRGDYDDQVDAWSQAMNYINSTMYDEGGLYVPEGDI